MSVADLPRYEHVREHIASRRAKARVPHRHVFPSGVVREYNERAPRLLDNSQLLAVYPLLMEPLTQQEIAERLGPGWTQRMVAYAWGAIAQMAGWETGSFDSAHRLRLLRIVAGIDPCWCAS